MAGSYCAYCGHRCFVYREVVVDGRVTWSGHLATCREGKAHDRMALRVDVDSPAVRNPAEAHEHTYGWSAAKALATGDGMERFVHVHERGGEQHEHVLRDGSIDAMLAAGGDVVKSTMWRD